MTSGTQGRWPLARAIVEALALPPVARGVRVVCMPSFHSPQTLRCPRRSSLPRSRGRRLDGMPAWIDFGASSFDLWFSGDSSTPPGRVVTALLRIAEAHCLWIATTDRLRDVLGYVDLRA